MSSCIKNFDETQISWPLRLHLRRCWTLSPFFGSFLKISQRKYMTHLYSILHFYGSRNIKVIITAFLFQIKLIVEFSLVHLLFISRHLPLKASMLCIHCPSAKYEIFRAPFPKSNFLHTFGLSFLNKFYWWLCRWWLLAKIWLKVFCVWIFSIEDDVSKIFCCKFGCCL